MTYAGTTCTVEADMARPVSEIIADIEDFKPSKGNWLELDALLHELFLRGSAPMGIDAMLHVFERYPGEDGAGVFWSIVHGLETLPGYESRLIESIRRVPSDFALLMVNRLLNTECREWEACGCFHCLSKSLRTKLAARRYAKRLSKSLTATRDDVSVGVSRSWHCDQPPPTDRSNLMICRG